MHTETEEGKLTSLCFMSQRVMQKMTWEEYMVVMFHKRDPSKTLLKLNCEPRWYVVQNLHNTTHLYRLADIV